MSRRQNSALKADRVMTTAEAQELLDRNSETIRDIIKLQEEAARPGGHSGAAARKEKLEARLHRRLLKLARWCDAPHPERVRSDIEADQNQAKAHDLIVTHGLNAKAAAAGRRPPVRPMTRPINSKGASYRNEGVYLNAEGRWVAQISHMSKQQFLGIFDGEHLAAAAVAKAHAAIAAGHGSVDLGANKVELKREDPLRAMNVATVGGLMPAMVAGHGGATYHPQHQQHQQQQYSQQQLQQQHAQYAQHQAQQLHHMQMQQMQQMQGQQMPGQRTITVGGGGGGGGGIPFAGQYQAPQFQQQPQLRAQAVPFAGSQMQPGSGSAQGSTPNAGQPRPGP